MGQAWMTSSRGLLVAAGLFGLGVGSSLPTMAEVSTTRSHGLAIHGEPQLPADFTHLRYVNPDAPKGGQTVVSALGSFDSLNPFILKGDPASGIGFTTETLTTGTGDEPSVEYGLIAREIEVPADRSFVIFHLRPEARFNDGQPITPEDVIWTFETLKEKGRPSYRNYYANVEKAEKIGDHAVKFSFSGPPNNELPVIVGQLPVLPSHYWKTRDFEKTTLEPPPSSGPYKVSDIDPGRSITYELDPDWWGKDLPINKGRYNIQKIRYEYYRDRDIAFQAFKGGEFDFRVEATTKDWATGYDINAVKDGKLIKAETSFDYPEPMQGFVMNLRRPLFQDPKVREALVQFYDFEWLNKNLYYGLMGRPDSYFWNSELASSGLPTGRELEILEPYRGQVPDEVFTKEFTLPKTDGSGNIRPQLRTALRLFKEAGWSVKDGILQNDKGEPFEFEILLGEPRMERVTLPYVSNLEKAGIKAKIRTVDISQYQKRVETFDYDMVIGLFGQSLSPGNEQRYYWTSAAADQPGTRNLMGLKDPVIDDLVEKLIQAQSREDLVAHSKALDRVLLWGHYLVPQQRNTKVWYAYWDRFGQPAEEPKFGLGFPDTWWIDPAKSAATDSYLNR